MYAIVSLLDEVSDQFVRQVWSRFEAACGLTGVQMAPLPHFSWQGAEFYQLEQAEQALAAQARQMQPFTVRADGLGVFTGPQPVIYIALVKGEALLKAHQSLWECLSPYTVNPNIYYQPARWIPHITLALHEADAGKLGCAIADVAFQKVEFQFQVDHFAVLYQAEGQAGLHRRFPFGAG